jgi:hypothetical protein
MVRRNLRPPSKKTINNAFAPFAMEIGKLTRSWNILQENLGEIFAQIVNDTNHNIPLLFGIQLKTTGRSAKC